MFWMNLTSNKGTASACFSRVIKTHNKNCQLPITLKKNCQSLLQFNCFYSGEYTFLNWQHHRRMPHSPFPARIHFLKMKPHSTELCFPWSTWNKNSIQPDVIRCHHNAEGKWKKKERRTHAWAIYILPGNGINKPIDTMTKLSMRMPGERNAVQLRPAQKE